MRSFELYAQATHESGIMPPPGLRITWLDHPGPREQALYDAITRALERAIAAGELDPADDAKRLAVAVAVLEQLPDGHTETMQELMLAERMARLRATSGSQTVRELLVRVGPDVAKPLDLTPEILLAGTRPLGQVVHDRDGSAPLRAVAAEARPAGQGPATAPTTANARWPTRCCCSRRSSTASRTRDDPVAKQAALPLLAMLILADTIDVDMLLDRIGIVFFETRPDDAPATERYRAGGGDRTTGRHAHQSA